MFLNFLNKQAHIFPLAMYRAAFGFLAFISIVRFMANGWVKACYLEPEFHFKYQYFEWVKPLDNITAMYGVVLLCAISALCIGVGFFYRIATVAFFILFTYLELLAQSWYLNHYYFVSIIALLLCFIPAQKGYSFDALRKKKIEAPFVPYWSVFILKLQITIVYFMAGLAKLKLDWLLEALPLKIWLKAKVDTPLIGMFFQYDETAYIFTYFAILYDLTIPFLLWNKKSRPYAFIAVVLFHVLTAILFNIGMFPWIMIAGSMIFISGSEWRRLFRKIPKQILLEKKTNTAAPKRVMLVFMIGFFVFQIGLPLRYLLYQENVLWTERNFRFSWNVMLMEKSGYAVFSIADKNSEKKWIEYPKEKLTVIQEKQMSFQPDMIWQYAQFLKSKYDLQGYDVSIKVKNYVTLNGRPSKEFISKEIDLVSIGRNDIYNYVQAE